MSVTGDKINVEESILKNAFTDTLYSHNINSELKCFQVVFQDEKELHLQVSPRVMVKLVYDVTKKDFKSLKILKEVTGANSQQVTLSKFSLSHIKDLLTLLSTLDLPAISKRKLAFAEENLALDERSEKFIKTLLSTNDGEDLLIKLIEDGYINRKDIVNTGYRKIQLETFQQMLEVVDFWKEYCQESEISDKSEEKAWQHFFQTNKWIFGYGLDLCQFYKEKHMYLKVK